MCDPNVISFFCGVRLIGQKCRHLERKEGRTRGERRKKRIKGEKRKKGKKEREGKENKWKGKEREGKEMKRWIGKVRKLIKGTGEERKWK